MTDTDESGLYHEEAVKQAVLEAYKNGLYKGGDLMHVVTPEKAQDFAASQWKETKWRLEQGTYDE